jgi:hypothetical protein
MHTRLVLLLGVLHGLHETISDHTEAIYRLSFSASKVADPMVIASAACVYGMLPGHLLMDCPNLAALYERDGAARGAGEPSLGLPGTINNAVARWVPRNMQGCPPLPWYVSSAKNVALGRSVLERGMRELRDELAAMVADGSISDSAHTARLRLRRVQCFLHAIQTSMTPWGDGLPQSRAGPNAEGLLGEANAESDSISVSICSQAGWEGCTLMHDIMQAVMLVIERADSENTTALSLAIISLEVRWRILQEHVQALG